MDIFEFQKALNIRRNKNYNFLDIKPKSVSGYFIWLEIGILFFIFGLIPLTIIFEYFWAVPTLSLLIFVVVASIACDQVFDLIKKEEESDFEGFDELLFLDTFGGFAILQRVKNLAWLITVAIFSLYIFTICLYFQYTFLLLFNFMFWVIIVVTNGVILHATNQRINEIENNRHIYYLKENT